VAIEEVQQDLVLLRLRNFWGTMGEWRLDWSRQSPLWTSPLQKRAPDEEGYFYMSVKDFIENFPKIFFIKMFDISLQRCTVKNHWTSISSGGCPNVSPAWRNNTQYYFDVGKPRTQIYLKLQVPNTQLYKKSKRRFIGIYVMVSRAGEFKLLNFNKADVVYGNEFYALSEFQVSLTITDPGRYIVLPCTYSKGHLSPYTIHMNSQAGITLHKCKEWSHISEIQHQWIRGSNAGGALSSAGNAFEVNEQYSLTVREKTFLSIQLHLLPYTLPFAEHVRGIDVSPFIGFYLFEKPSKKGAKVFSEDKILLSTPFINSEVSELIGLQPGEYVVVPCTFQPGVESDYQLQIYTDLPLEKPRMILPAPPTVDGQRRTGARTSTTTLIPVALSEKLNTIKGVSLAAIDEMIIQIQEYKNGLDTTNRRSVIAMANHIQGAASSLKQEVAALSTMIRQPNFAPVSTTTDNLGVITTCIYTYIDEILITLDQLKMRLENPQKQTDIIKLARVINMLTKN